MSSEVYLNPPHDSGYPENGLTCHLMGIKSHLMDQAVLASLYRLFFPLVRLLVRKGIAHKELGDLIKRVYIDVSEQELIQTKGKATTSAIAIMSGMTRKEVAALRDMPLEGAGHSNRYNRAVRVISGWRVDAEFTTARGKPRVLPLHGDSGSFEALVARYSGDMPVKAMLDELQRVGAVETSGSGGLRLVAEAYLPTNDEKEGLAILGVDTGLLIETIGYNLDPGKAEKRFQRKVAYDNLPREALQEFRPYMRVHAHNLLERYNHWLSEHDRDVRGEEGGTGRMRAGVGIYYFEEPVKTKKP